MGQLVTIRGDPQEGEGACSLLLLLREKPGLKGTTKFQHDRFQLNMRKEKKREKRSRTIMNYLFKKKKQKSSCMFQQCTGLCWVL